MLDIKIKEYDYKGFIICKQSKNAFSVYYGLMSCGCYTSLKRAKDIVNMLIKFCIDYYMSYKPQLIVNRIVQYREEFKKEVLF